MSHLNALKPDVEWRNRHWHALMRKDKAALASLKKRMLQGSRTEGSLKSKKRMGECVGVAS